MLCEYRSDDEELLAFMKAEFERIFEEARCDGVEVKVKKIGDRPCEKGLAPERMAALRDASDAVITEITGKPVVHRSSSTDCNIPLSLGIPGITVGVYSGMGAHTREERILKSSLHTGLEIGIKVAIATTK